MVWARKVLETALPYGIFGDRAGAVPSRVTEHPAGPDGAVHSPS
jgi:hypothetical protein